MSVHLLRIFLTAHRATTKLQWRCQPVPAVRFLNVQPVRAAHSNAGNESKVTTWRSIVTRFVPIGICLAAVMQWRAFRRSTDGVERIATNFEIESYRVLPLKAFSRLWGGVADLQLPESLRPFVYGLYSRCFSVNLNEAAHEDLTYYPSLSDFFARALKPNSRPIDPQSDLVSPCDGTVLHLTCVNTGKVEQVKGVTYSLESFLGENIWNKPDDNCDYHRSLLHQSHLNTTLYQCIIYLAPGDYHRFHSPTDWKPYHRRHFPGDLLSVNPSVAKRIPGLFCLNERAVYVGKWKHGFFSYTAVGATNVGSMRVYFDDTLRTNHPKVSQAKDMLLEDDLILSKGEMIGEFRMGSTIVLIFEAPENFQFNVRPGQRVRVGQTLGTLRNDTSNRTIEKNNSNLFDNL